MTVIEELLRKHVTLALASMSENVFLHKPRTVDELARLMAPGLTKDLADELHAALDQLGAPDAPTVVGPP